MFAGALAISFFAIGCSKNEGETLEKQSSPSPSFHPDTLKHFKSKNPPKRKFINKKDFRKGRYHKVLPQLYGELNAAGVNDAKIDRGVLLFFQSKRPRRIGQNDKILTPLELVIAGLEADEDGLKSKGFQETFQQFRSDPDLRLFYGKALFYSGRYEKAENVFLQDINEDNLFPLGVSYMGDLFRLKGEYDNAERAYRTLLRKFPQEFITQLHLGDMLMELKRFGAAEDVFLKLRKQNQNRNLVDGRLATLYEKLGEGQTAEQYRPK